MNGVRAMFRSGKSCLTKMRGDFFLTNRPLSPILVRLVERIHLKWMVLQWLYRFLVLRFNGMFDFITDRAMGCWITRWMGRLLLTTNACYLMVIAKLSPTIARRGVWSWYVGMAFTVFTGGCHNAGSGWSGIKSEVLSIAGCMLGFCLAIALTRWW